jgi:hypothetical protein
LLHHHLLLRSMLLCHPSQAKLTKSTKSYASSGWLSVYFNLYWPPIAPASRVSHTDMSLNLYVCGVGGTD